MVDTYSMHAHLHKQLLYKLSGVGANRADTKFQLKMGEKSGKAFAKGSCNQRA